MIFHRTLIKDLKKGSESEKQARSFQQCTAESQVKFFAVMRPRLSTCVDCSVLPKKKKHSATKSHWMYLMIGSCPSLLKDSNVQTFKCCVCSSNYFLHKRALAVILLLTSRLQCFFINIFVTPAEAVYY